MTPKKNSKKKIKATDSEAKCCDKKKTAKRVTKKPVKVQSVPLPPEPTQPKTKGLFDYMRYLFIKPPKDNES